MQLLLNHRDLSSTRPLWQTVSRALENSIINKKRECAAAPPEVSEMRKVLAISTITYTQHLRIYQNDGPSLSLISFLKPVAKNLSIVFWFNNSLLVGKTDLGGEGVELIDSSVLAPCNPDKSSLFLCKSFWRLSCSLPNGVCLETAAPRV